MYTVRRERGHVWKRGRAVKTSTKKDVKVPKSVMSIHSSTGIPLTDRP